MKPALQKKGLRLLQLEGNFPDVCVSMDETCPTEKGIATSSIIPVPPHSSQSRWNLPYRKRDCDLLQVCSLFRLFHLRDETCPTEKGIATKVKLRSHSLLTSRWNLPYRKRDCDTILPWFFIGIVYNWWNLPYRKRDCDMVVVAIYITPPFLWWNLPYRKRDCDLITIRKKSNCIRIHFDETCPTEKGIATWLLLGKRVIA